MKMVKNRRTRLIALVMGAGVLMGAGYAIGQDSAMALLQAHSNAQRDPVAYGALIDRYAAMPGDVPATKQAARLALVSRGGGEGAAAIIVQNQKLIEQNAQIIGLLKQIAAKK